MEKRGIFDDPEGDDTEVDDTEEDLEQQLTESELRRLSNIDQWFIDNPEPTRELLAQPNRDQYDRASDWERALNRWRDEKKAWEDWNHSNKIYTELKEEIVNPG